jgi:DNA-binding CsgD family transcriptional regulator
MKVSLEGFSEAVAQIHEAAAAPQQWPQALRAIMSLIGGARASLIEVDRAGALVGMDQVGHDPATASEYVKDFYAIDPTRELVTITPPLKAITVYEVFTEAYRHRHPYFDFARRNDIGDVAGLHCPSADDRKSLLGVQRSVRAEPYGAEEKNTLELVSRHISIARRIGSRLSEAWTAAGELEAAFGAIAWAALVVDGAGVVRHANDAAESLLKRGEGVTVRNGKLGFANTSAQARFLNAVRSAVAEPGVSSAYLIHLGGKTAELMVAPLRPHDPRAGQWQLPLALVIMNSGEADADAIAWRLRQVYALTPAEARIVSLLALGKNLREIALATATTEPTLRTHLRSIFSKTNTRRQAELVAVALRGSAFEPVVC